TAERTDARHRVAGRTARGFNARRHGVIEGRALVLIDQLHRAGDQLVRVEEGGRARAQHVDDGVADGADVEASGGDGGLGHARPNSGPRALTPALGFSTPPKTAYAGRLTE